MNKTELYYPPGGKGLNDWLGLAREIVSARSDVITALSCGMAIARSWAKARPSVDGIFLSCVSGSPSCTLFIRSQEPLDIMEFAVVLGAVLGFKMSCEVVDKEPPMKAGFFVLYKANM